MESVGEWGKWVHVHRKPIITRGPVSKYNCSFRPFNFTVLFSLRIDRKWTFHKHISFVNNFNVVSLRDYIATVLKHATQIHSQDTVIFAQIGFSFDANLRSQYMHIQHKIMPAWGVSNSQRNGNWSAGASNFSQSSEVLQFFFQIVFLWFWLLCFSTFGDTHIKLLNAHFRFMTFMPLINMRSKLLRTITVGYSCESSFTVAHTSITWSILQQSSASSREKW